MYIAQRPMTNGRDANSGAVRASTVYLATQACR